MALYLGENKVNINLDGVLYHLNLQFDNATINDNSNYDIGVDSLKDKED